ncbi:MAG: WD40 repeat domain-containing protein [Roseibium sp.]
MRGSMSAALQTSQSAGAEVVSPLIDVTTLAFAANVTDCKVLSGGGTAAIAFGDGSLALIDLAGLETDPAAATRSLALHRVACTALAPLGQGVVSAGQDGRVVVVDGADAVDGRQIFSTDGAWIEALTVHEAAGLVALAVGTGVHVLKPGGTEVCSADFGSTVTGLCFDREGKRLAASHYGGVSVIATDTGSVDLRLAWKGAHIGLTWSPDDRFIVTATQEKELHIWDLATMEDFRIGGYPRKIHELDWMADGLTMACSGADAITAWPFNAGSPAGRVPVEIGFAFGATVTAVAANPARPLVAGGFSSGNLLIGAARKGEAVVAAKRTGRPVTALGWSETGDLLVAGDAGGTVAVCRLPDDLGIT